MGIKKNDFIEISFIGRIKANNQIFDLTDEDLAKKKGIYNPKVKYYPKKICVGHRHIIPGLDSQLEGKEIGKSYVMNIDFLNAFGAKNPKLIKIMNTNIFKKENINPFPGLQIAADGYLGIIRSVTGGRAVVDFNHPLAGKDIIYELTILREIKEDIDKLKILLLNELALNEENYKILENEVGYSIKILKNIPENIKNKFIELVKEIIPLLYIQFSLDDKKDIVE